MLSDRLEDAPFQMLLRDIYRGPPELGLARQFRHMLNQVSSHR